jgi:hypothetical protein
MAYIEYEVVSVINGVEQVSEEKYISVEQRSKDESVIEINGIIGYGLVEELFKRVKQ